jgi:hypothetical protein
MTRKVQFLVGARELSLLQSFRDLSASNFVGTGEFSTAVERLGLKLTKQSSSAEDNEWSFTSLSRCTCLHAVHKKIETFTASTSLIIGALGGAFG